MKISVIIPCYNQGHFLNACLHSVQSQTFDNWECIIVNDGSTDETASIASTFSQSDKRFRYIEKTNAGLSAARNTGMAAATGDYIQFLDSDDLLAKDKFSRSAVHANAADIIISDFVFFNDEQPAPFKPSFKLEAAHMNLLSILNGWDEVFVFPPNAGLFKNSLFAGLQFNESLKAREDWLMWLQLFLKEPAVVFIDEPLALYRHSGGSMSKNRFLMDENQVKVYEIVYQLLPEKYHTVFFEKVIRTFGKLIGQYQDLLTKTRSSSSYRLGNFFVKAFNKITFRSGRA